MALPSNFFYVDFYDLNTMSFKFVSEICITFEMPMSSYNRPDRKINVSFLFCPFASDILRFEEFKITRKNLSIISFLLASRTLVDKSTFLIAEGVFEPKRLVRPLDHMLVASFDQVIPLETNILSLLQMTKLQKCLSKAKFTVIHFQHFF